MTKKKLNEMVRLYSNDIPFIEEKHKEKKGKESALQKRIKKAKEIAKKKEIKK